MEKQSLTIIAAFMIVIMLVNSAFAFYTDRKIRKITNDIQSTRIQLQEKDKQIKQLNDAVTEKDKQINFQKDEIHKLNKLLQSKRGKWAEALAMRGRITGPKIAYLTFDDGPGPHTYQILQVLKEHGINASFFVVGAKAEEQPDLVRAQFQAGHAVLPHTYSHKYSEIYASKDAFLNDLHRVEHTITSILGFAVPKIFRFPGGVTNAVASRAVMTGIVKQLHGEGYIYADWNASAADTAIGRNKDTELGNILNASQDKNEVVILCHDIQPDTHTLDMLGELIKTMKARGFIFKTFRDISDEEIYRLSAVGTINLNLEKLLGN
ncbi:MAG: polysaccharide deacetylase [Hyphomonadaceae bacterium]|nr:polysaccharide deacetylase [Clostridia bacterium]